MTPEELENWMSQFATSNSEKMGMRWPPFCFTEQGVAMLSSVLNSETAISVNIQIIRIFTRMRQMLFTHKDILLQLEKIERRLAGHDDNIALIFEYLKKLLTPPRTPGLRIGFKINNEE